jgi:diamine N-acetyltransferase
MSDAVVTSREITSANEADVRALRVAPDQERFVSSVADSLDETEATPEARPWFRAIYAGERPIGFVMLSYDMPPGDPEQPFRYFFWRLLIDADHQGHGYGRAAISIVVDQLRGLPGPTSSSRPSTRVRVRRLRSTGRWGSSRPAAGWRTRRSTASRSSATGMPEPRAAMSCVRGTVER